MIYKWKTKLEEQQANSLLNESERAEFVVVEWFRHPLRKKCYANKHTNLGEKMTKLKRATNFAAIKLETAQLVVDQSYTQE